MTHVKIGTHSLNLGMEERVEGNQEEGLGRNADDPARTINPNPSKRKSSLTPLSPTLSILRIGVYQKMKLKRGVVHIGVWRLGGLGMLVPKSRLVFLVSLPFFFSSFFFSFSNMRLSSWRLTLSSSMTLSDQEWSIREARIRLIYQPCGNTKNETALYLMDRMLRRSSCS